MENIHCRLCGCELIEDGELVTIFDKDESGFEISELIQECLHLFVDKSDLLSKSVCLDCLDTLENLYKFKKKSFELARKSGNYSRTNGGACLDENEVFLGFDKEEIDENNKSVYKLKTISNQLTKSDAQTLTEDLELKVLCTNCKSEISNDDFEQFVADSLNRNGTSMELKTSRDGNKKGADFYHELDDSLCSSLTELTNTEPQVYEIQSDASDVEDSERPVKRCKADVAALLEKKYKDEEEYVFNSKSLLQLCLNVINKENLADYKPVHFTKTSVEPNCSCCGQIYKNCKLLALHEVSHINIELGDKVDSPHLWHESRDFAEIRNKWLTYDDEEDEQNENGEIEGEVETENENGAVEMEEDDENLLVQVSSDQINYDEVKTTRQVTLINGKPFVDGAPLSDYPKEERRAFYHSMRINGVNKRFCTLCRYSFKDNWAIESHYFSMACYYTCRYCGMRFNKQRNRFDEHVEQHLENGDNYSTKVFAASKNNNFVPKVLSPKSKMNITAKETLNLENLKRTRGQADVKLENNVQTSQSKTGNQAFYCRKCYQVFFKLDEFNVHSKNCDFSTAFPNSHIHTKSIPNLITNGENLNPTKSKSTAPIQSVPAVVKEVNNVENIEQNSKDMSSTSQGPFICYVCNIPFPTIYSRNSHMRIHRLSDNSPLANLPSSVTIDLTSSLKANSNSNPNSNSNSNNYRENPYNIPSSLEHFVKEEPMEFEPEVEIHEAQTNQDFTTNLGPAISLTPIPKNPNQKLQINPEVMKLVQNNPQLSIKNSSPVTAEQNQANIQMNSQMLAAQMDIDRTYKCSSCWETFSNKSHLYFHKKNQCEGSKYPCPFCKKRFGTEAAYSSHIFYSHPE